jgi:2-keto-4-pentenoate hydratase/2-oxohepta-3-ene-1,7-dioic acid hydratase in catechol pathway
MKIVRFLDTYNQPTYGSLLPDGSACIIEGDIFKDYSVTDQRVESVRLLAPIVPKSILCVGLNYRKHAEETKAKIPEFPVLFFKNTASLQHPNMPIELSPALNSEKVDYEGELVVVIKKDCKNVPRTQAVDYILGYTCGNDVSARDWQKHWGGSQWCRGKSFDTFAPLGPCLVTVDELTEPHNLRLRTLVNGKVLQDTSTNDMIFDIPTLIEFLSAGTTLQAGTAIFTGTPSGVGMARTPQLWLKHGDTVSVEIEGIGTLTNPVEKL